MVVQHNLSAINSYRQLGITTGLQAKSSEKLSSGYKINRAADDAAGLSISERMRRQIRGLSQASKNAQDGVSFSQIADGALNEVHEMLQRGNELAVKASNDTLTDEDRAYINIEITKIKEELDAIGAKTTFNEIPVFPANGSTASEGTAAQNNLLKKIAEDMIPAATKQLLNTFSGSLGSALNSITSATPEAGAIDLQLSYIDGQGGILAYMQGGFYGANGAIDVFATESLTMKVDKSDYTSDTLDAKSQQELESTIAHELMHGLMDIVMPEGMYVDDAADASINFSKWFAEGTAQLVGGGYTSGWNNSLMTIAKSSASEASKLSSVSNYLKTKTVETNEYGHGYLACAYLCQLASGSTTVSKESLISGANNIFNGLISNYNKYASGAPGVKSFSDVINSAIAGSGKTLNSAIAGINNGSADASKFVLDLTNASKSYGTLNGAGSLIASSLNSVNILGAAPAGQQQMYVKNYSGSSSTDGADTVIYLQVGTENGAAHRLEVKRFALSSSSLGVSTTNTLTHKDSQKAISEFKDALFIVSSIRSYYGATQNRLEHTISNLDNTGENTTSSESKIRDTDMAAEMVKYSNQNILMNAGQAMLAQANQTNQGVMALLQ